MSPTAIGSASHPTRDGRVMHFIDGEGNLGVKGDLAHRSFRDTREDEKKTGEVAARVSQCQAIDEPDLEHAALYMCIVLQ